MRIGDKYKGRYGGYCIITDIKGSWVYYTFYDKPSGVKLRTSACETEFHKCYHTQLSVTVETDQHYNNTNGSLYKFAQDHELNAYEFDILKRVVRCRKKGQFKEDLEKTKRVIDLYLKEFEAL